MQRPARDEPRTVTTARPVQPDDRGNGRHAAVYETPCGLTRSSSPLTLRGRGSALRTGLPGGLGPAGIDAPGRRAIAGPYAPRLPTGWLAADGLSTMAPGAARPRRGNDFRMPSPPPSAPRLPC